jgi:hypothetical protein
MRSRHFLLVASSLILGACASTSQGGSAGGSTSGKVVATQITAEQIAKANVQTAYDAIDRLHRSWWKDLSAGTTTEVVVYMNNQKVDGGKEALRQIPASDVALLEYLKSTDAVMRFGQDANGGAIIVTRK